MTIFNPKTPTLYKRDEDFKVTNELKDPRYSLINHWVVTEKMDGMSVVFSVHPETNQFYGRTENTKFSSDQDEFMSEQLANAIRNLYNIPLYDDRKVDIYAELVGPGVNGNSHNLKEYRLYVFDVRVNDFWLDYNNMIKVSKDAGFANAPFLGRLTTEDAISMLNQYRDTSTIPAATDGRSEYFEGIVARSDPYLYDNLGNRVMWKLKVSDLRKETS